LNPLKAFRQPAIRREFVLYFALIGAAALASGLSDSVFANYFKDAYDVTTGQRAFIEFPRELPGVLCALVIASLSAFGDLRLSMIAQALAFTGLAVLGLFTPSFAVMLIFLFINSLGTHLFMPLQDSIGMALAEPDKIGKRMSQYAGLKTAISCLAGLIMFFGVRGGYFSFATPVKLSFVIGAVMFAVAFAAAILLNKHMGGASSRPGKQRFKISIPRFRKEYKYYYTLTVIFGVQKQISYVYGGWVIVDLLLKGADVMAVLVIVTSFIGILFMNLVSKWFDRLGIKRMLYIDALALIGVYSVFGLVVWGICAGALPGEGWPVMTVYALFVLDRLTMSLGMVRSVYLRSIAVDQAEVTEALSTGISLDHVISIIGAQVCGLVWVAWGPQWVFFIAAAFSFGNLFVAHKAYSINIS
jgi:predicted MFS family arabinose efflux permease